MKSRNQYQPEGIRKGFWESCKIYESSTFILFNSPIHHPICSSQTGVFPYFSLGFFFLALIPLLVRKMSGLHLITGKFPLSYKMLLLFAVSSCSKHLIFFFKVFLINQFLHLWSYRQAPTSKPDVASPLKLCLFIIALTIFYLFWYQELFPNNLTTCLLAHILKLEQQFLI